MIYTSELIDQIALNFISVLTEWFEHKPSAGEVENANDHFDANVAMEEAFKMVNIITVDKDGITDEANELWNPCWNRAIKLSR